MLQDAETNRRYEVEVQLGQTDEAHIIRTLEYWDIERKRYPQYDHCAVIVAEDITSRFLNVISLFNGSVPLIAIQMAAYRIEDRIALIFTTVLDELSRGLVDEDEEVSLATDRAYWEARASRETVAMADELLDLVRQFEPQMDLKFNKFYIGLAKEGRPRGFAIFRPRQKLLSLEPRLEPSEEMEKALNDAGIDLMPYDKRFRRYRLRLVPKDINRCAAVLLEILRRARDAVVQ